MKTIAIIPARYNSSRLPGKVILKICNKPMIQYVYEAAKKAKYIDEVYIATDSLKVKQICEKFTNNVIITKSHHESGTDRIAEAIKSIDCDLVINIQGDEPLINPSLIDDLALTIKNNNVEMVSAMHNIFTTKELQSPNSVKVVVDSNSNALYFSRSIIPHDRDKWEFFSKNNTDIPENLNFYKHIGIYAYTKEFLSIYTSLDMTYLEKLEKLEQLRVLENGYKIKMIKTDYIPIGVDTQEDLEKVRRIIEC